MPRKRKPWSHVAGKRATTTEPSSRVRVYERADLPGIFMTCAWDTTSSGRPQEMKLPDGITREAAEALAELTAARRRERILAGRDDLGRRQVRLAALLEAYHASSDAEAWSLKHRGDAERSREFWLHALGAGALVESLSKAEVSKAAADARRSATWGVRKERKLLAYIRAATRWGCEQAELYPHPPLRGLRMPKYEPDTEELVYDAERETPLLLGGHPSADWRDVLAVNIAADTGRRISAILSLRAEDIVTDGDQVLLRFRAAFDKGDRGALVPVSPETAELLAQALERDLVQEFGWLFPEGRLDHDDPRDKPRGKTTAIKGLHGLEELVGVTRIRGRGFHGLKRAHVTASMETSQGDTALVGDITGNLSAELLRRVYRKANRKRTAAQVTRVRGRLSGAQKSDEDAREHTRETEGESSDA